MTSAPHSGVVTAVHRSGTHTFSKPTQHSIRLLAGLGVEGDAHSGTTVKHRSRVRRDPTQPNLRQAHLIHAELHDQLATEGLPVEPGQMGENITPRGVDLLGLATGTRLHIGDDAVVEITGLRNPCAQLNGLHDGLMTRLVHRDPDGSVVREAGAMGIVLTGGEVRPGDPIRVVPPDGPHQPLAPV